MPIHHLIPAGVRNLLSAHLLRVLPAFGILAACASLTGCSLFASAGGGQTDTDTVPLPKRGDSTSYDFTEESDLIADADSLNPSGDNRPGMGWVPDSAGDPPVVSQDTASSADIGVTEKADDGAPKQNTQGIAAAWSAPHRKTPVLLKRDSIPPLSKPDTGSLLEVPVPKSPVLETEDSRPLLPLSEFRKRVFAIQQKEEADRFRDAIKDPGAADENGDLGNPPSPSPDGDVPTKTLKDLTEIPAPRAEPVAEDTPVSPDSPRVKAAYQVYRWNLMETLAGAERAYWNLHFTDQQFAELEQSLSHLAGINDKARIGVLRKTRSASDILATETMRSHRQISVAEADARRTSAMAELASYYTAYSTEGSSATSRPTLPVRTESPANLSQAADAAALIGRADKIHPLYIGARLRDGLPDPQPGATPSAHIKERVEGSLERLRTARETVGKTRTQIEIFSSAYDENLRNFGSGKINLPGITNFEKSYLTARQKHLDALLDYQNSLIDLELEVGDFLENRGQEIPLSELLEEEGE